MRRIRRLHRGNMLQENDINLSEFGGFLIRQKLADEKHASFMVWWVRKFFSEASMDPALTKDDRIRLFLESLGKAGRYEDWQIEQAEQALRLYFVNFKGAQEPLKAPVVSVDIQATGRVRKDDVLEALKNRLRIRHYSYRTEQTYVDWISRFFAYLDTRGGDGTAGYAVTESELRDFLAYLAVRRNVGANTQNQAFSALLFMAREILGIEPGNLGDGVRAKRGVRLPVVLSVGEMKMVLEAMSGTTRLMAEILYGGGLRVMECLRLRVKDIDFENSLVFVRSGKGDKDRSTLLSDRAKALLKAHMEKLKDLFEKDRAAGLSGVWLPDALERKYPSAGKELGWQWLFPSRSLSMDPRSGLVRRHHVSDMTIQRAVKAAAEKAQIMKPISVHTLRHSFATHLLLHGVDIRQIQDYLGHANVETTMIYTHVVKDFRSPVKSPADLL